jgi:hypothetical protein
MWWQTSAAFLTMAMLGGCVAHDVDAPALADRRVALVGGKLAQARELFATVAITDREGVGECTGTLIEPDVVLTAAHCVVIEESRGHITDLLPDTFLVIAGALDLTKPPADVERVSVREIVRHPDYLASDAQDESGLGRHADLALLVLERPITRLSPVRILSAREFAELVVPGAPLLIAGYGASDLALSDFDRLHIAETPFVRDNGYELIAGGPGKPDTCSGDSGGPAYLTVEGDVLLLGAASRGVSSTEACGVGGIYTLVPAYADWITQHSTRASDLPACATHPGRVVRWPLAVAVALLSLFAGRRWRRRPRRPGALDACDGGGRDRMLVRTRSAAVLARSSTTSRGRHSHVAIKSSNSPMAT